VFLVFIGSLNQYEKKEELEIEKRFNERGPLGNQQQIKELAFSKAFQTISYLETSSNVKHN